MSGLNRLSATAAARKLASREITAEALLTDCLERIAEREADVHAWTFLDTDAAMRRARALDAQGTSGLLHGLPIAVKDLFDTFDMPSSYGSPIYAKHRPAWDAACVAMVSTNGCGSSTGRSATPAATTRASARRLIAARGGRRGRGAGSGASRSSPRTR